MPRAPILGNREHLQPPTQGSVGAGPARTREERADEDVGAEEETMEIKREELKD